MRTQVVTYAFAYIGGQINLCAAHAEDEAARDVAGVPTLGQVRHGAHYGYCPLCDVPAAGAEVEDMGGGTWGYPED